MTLYADAHMRIDFENRVVTLDGLPLVLTNKEYELIAYLASHPGELVPRATLLRSIWGYGASIRTRTLDAHVARVRARLGRYSGQYIETVFRGGYRFRPFFEPEGISAGFGAEQLPLAV
jgi:two-component system response regulator RegX3